MHDAKRDYQGEWQGVMKKAQCNKHRAFFMKREEKYEVRIPGMNT
ncbi:MAG: hypothetical protein WGN25_08985 [Candidatus Electrothrix sp. GW3-4]